MANGPELFSKGNMAQTEAGNLAAERAGHAERQRQELAESRAFEENAAGARKALLQVESNLRDSQYAAGEEAAREVLLSAVGTAATVKHDAIRKNPAVRATVKDAAALLNPEIPAAELAPESQGIRKTAAFASYEAALGEDRAKIVSHMEGLGKAANVAESVAAVAAGKPRRR